MSKLSRKEQLKQYQAYQQKQKWLWSAALLFAVFFFVWIGIRRTNQINSNNIEVESSSSLETVAQGEAIYTTYCAACHGPDLEGEANWQEPNPDGSFRAPPHDESGHTWHHNDTILLEAIRLGGARLQSGMGVSKMPAYADLITEEEIQAVLIYIKSTWPDDMQMRH